MNKYKRENIYDFANYLNKEVTVFLNGGREIKGILKSYDNIANLVLDNVMEKLSNGKYRELGLVFVRGSNFLSFIPGNIQKINNPFDT
jgi:small nuclear ribonucleoprotein (snRNP)-like protein